MTAATLCGAPTAPEPRPLADVKAVLAQAPPATASQSLRALNVVLVADTKDHGEGEHDYPLWQKRWAVLLGGSSGEATETQVNLHGSRPVAADAESLCGAPGVKVTRAWQWPSEEQWGSAHVVVAFCYLAWNEARFQELERFLARGGGLVLVHSATWTQPEPSARLAALVGVGGFTQWREGPLGLDIAVDHPICRGLPARIDFVDEAYWPPTPAPSPGVIATLATSREVADKNAGQSTPQPLFWTHVRGQGRVFGCVPGHHNWTFDDPYFRILLLRGVAWAAGESPYRFDPLVLRGARVKR